MRLRERWMNFFILHITYHDDLVVVVEEVVVEEVVEIDIMS
jgi:hypothetical protein